MKKLEHPLQSRALAGVANRTFVFVLLGSLDACRTAWDEISLNINFK